MKDRITLMRGEEANRERKIFEAVIKQIESQRIKHFLDIAEEKYEDSSLLYFKILPNHELYKKTVSNLASDTNYINTTGLIDISFAHPSKEHKELLHIYDSTQILYTIEQSHQMENPLVPILIMNHLPLDRRLPPKFENYCCFLNRSDLHKNSMD